ncbi:SAM-dependent methyltransferase [Streptomyces sp. CC53]|uniref:class I SAM-dependent methyltransferase n=1 Tax=unclassified Streptomyces TaxID=2593676 RepID=UPI0008DCC957|nr:MULTISPECIES: class I SAM-dependent methyltransferase [unclassified Streptomyces]OII63531.1 SAM-dependent methyltransferase [Streptomyces sp. CC53]
MFTAEGPTLRELTAQALSSVEHGYDLLAPKFDVTPFRTPAVVLEATAEALRPWGPFDAGLDVCCGTGAGTGLLRELCRERVTGVDVSAGMLARARAAHPPEAAPGPRPEWVRADVRALPFRAEFDLAVSFGAAGHFLPRERPGLFARVHTALRPGGRFAFPVVAPPRVGSAAYWTSWAFDTAMRVRNALWWPPFVMYYRTWPLRGVLDDLERAGFGPAGLVPLEALGRRADGAPRCRLVVARRPG